MRPDFDYVEDKWLARKVYNKLSVRYILAISCIAIMIVSNQVVARKLMSRQLDDSRVINVAGRQRMLSQKLTKEVLMLVNEKNPTRKGEVLDKALATYNLWERSHRGLQFGDPGIGLPGMNSPTILTLFDSIQLHFNSISDNFLIISNRHEFPSKQSNKEISESVEKILAHEPEFLLLMDQIVFQYDAEAKERVSSLIRLETTLLFIALIVLLLEIIFIFWPTAVYTKSIMNDLIESDEKQKNLREKLVVKTREDQKAMSAVFFEGQERERRRIARDLHDGIGQLLTGLKFQIEAMDTDDPESIVFKVGEMKGLAGDIIKEVRRVSFDLRPSVLSDYGLTSAIRNITQELNKLTDININFTNKTDFNIRLEKRLETHLFRIVQESVNNALKYSEARNINVAFLHDEEFLEISIKDDGVGFDMEDVRSLDPEQRKGHGLFNMTERCDFIDAQLTIDTKPNKGTQILVRMSLPEINEKSKL